MTRTSRWWSLIVVALSAVGHVAADPVDLVFLQDRSTQLLDAKDPAAMEHFLDSLSKLAANDAEHAFVHSLMQARWYRHTSRQHEAYRILDSLGRTIPNDRLEHTYFVNYQLAKTLDGLGLFDEARRTATKARNAAKALGRTVETLQMELLLAEIDLSDAHYDKALNAFHECLAFAREHGNGEGVGRSLIGIGNVHYHQEQDSLALLWYEKAFEHARRVGDGGLILSSVLNMGAAKTYVDGEEAAMEFYNSLLDTTDASWFPRIRADILANLASLLSDLEQHEEALRVSNEAMSIYSEERDTVSMAQLDLYRATALWALGRKEEALKETALAIRRSPSLSLRGAAYLKNAEYLRSMGRWAEAYDALSMAHSLNDSLARRRFTQSIAAAQVQYETAEKDHRIAEQSQALALAAAEDRRKNIQRIALGISALAVTIIALLLARSLRNRRRLADQERELHAQRVDELLKRNEIDALNAMMEGQEKERDRVARDLHDRLGSMLSAIKHQIDGLDADIQGLQAEQRGNYSKVNRMLDEAVGEVRRISHDMVSVTLARFGLEKALEDLCDSVRLNGRLAVELSLFGLEKRMDRALEITIYRMVQELVSNVLKHANARELSIAVTRGPGRISVIVADDGRGFDTSAAADGIGLSNVRARAAAMGAQVTVNSTSTTGTTVSIEGPVVE